MFTKRHYEAIAEAIQEAHPNNRFNSEERSEPAAQASVEQWHQTINDFAEMLQRDNSQFDVGRFFKACRPGASVSARKSTKHQANKESRQ